MISELHIYKFDWSLCNQAVQNSEINILPRVSALTVKLDPVCALKCYMDRTDKFRSIDGPVFLTLYKPYRGIDASTVAKILNDAIVLAGLSKDQFSASHLDLLVLPGQLNKTLTLTLSCRQAGGRHVQYFLNITFMQNHLLLTLTVSLI